MLCLTSERPGRTAIVTRVLILITLLQGAALAQTSQTYQTCNLTNGTGGGIFGSFTASGTYTYGASADTSNISVIETYIVDGNIVTDNYTFTGTPDGSGWTQTSQNPVYCVLAGCPSNAPPTYGVVTLRLLDRGNGTAEIDIRDEDSNFSGFGTLSCSSAGSGGGLPPNCGPFHVVTKGNGTPIMFAYYRPSGGMNLSAAAAACNFKGFNWQQQVEILPCPNPMQAANLSTLNGLAICGTSVTGSSPDDKYYAATPYSLKAPPSFSDPPPGGYANLAGYDPSPFYYPVDPNAVTPNQPLVLSDGKDHNPLDPADPTGKTHLSGVDNTTFLAISDTPADACLPGSGSDLLSIAQHNLRLALFCNFQEAPENTFVGFTTSLVGISNDGNNTPISLPNVTYDWQTTYNGTVGGTSGLSVSAPPDPGSGVGYITITSLNGVPVPPIVPQDQIKVIASGLAYSRVSKTFNGTVTITNTSGAAITTPASFQVFLNDLASGVTLSNSTGTFNQFPYITIPTLTTLAPGQSITVAVQFANPSGATINFTPEFYAGSFQ